ncbi:MAG: twin-arginine translocation signal domain-containing protein [Pirellulales bacterium]
MNRGIQRREFLQLTAAATVCGLAGPNTLTFAASPAPATRLVSPGCRRSKVKVARLYMGHPAAHWPSPKMNFEEEVRSYAPAFEAVKDELADLDFFVDQVVSSPEQVQALAEKLKTADGILVIQVTIGVSSILAEILKAARPTIVFAIPYSGHEWADYGRIQKQPGGELFDAILTTDRKQLAVAVRPFRAIHHLREAKILDVTTRLPGAYAEQVKAKFGTEIKQVGLQAVVDAYNAVSDADAQAETDRWLKEAVQLVEPSKEGVFKACKQALAFERMLAAEDATVLTVDCYGSMWDKTIKLPAYPCLGFSRLNSMGLGGICESDLRSAMTHIIFQGLAGKPGFISDPTMDESRNAIILAHCMGTVNMFGPGHPNSPYKIRTVLERQEGVVPQVFMPVGPRATQAILVGMDTLLYFTGQVIEAPDVDRGCRSKITVKVDGSAEKLWKNWSSGLHRSTCYGDLTKDLERFCRFTNIKMVNEAI